MVAFLRPVTLPLPGSPRRAPGAARRPWLSWLGLWPSVVIMLSACQAMAPVPEPAPPAVPPTVSITALYLQPAERSLIEGIRLYEEAAFARAETSLRRALNEGLADPRDRAAAQKYLAFITCAFARLAECETHFRQAFAADPQFRLDAKEIGHPIWGPVYRRVAAEAAQ